MKRREEGQRDSRKQRKFNDERVRERKRKKIRRGEEKGIDRATELSGSLWVF